MGDASPASRSTARKGSKLQRRKSQVRQGSMALCENRSSTNDVQPIVCRSSTVTATFIRQPSAQAQQGQQQRGSQQHQAPQVYETTKLDSRSKYEKYLEHRLNEAKPTDAY